MSVYKRKIPLERGCYTNFFLSEQANFSASERLGKKFPTVQNGPEQKKNLSLIKLVSKWKKAITKEHTRFLVFHFWDLKLVPIDSVLNSTSGNLTFWKFLKNVGMVPRKSDKFENPS